MGANLLGLGANALDALVLPIFRHDAGEPAPKGIARFCSATDDEEAVLLARLFQSVNTRWVMMWGKFNA